MSVAAYLKDLIRPLGVYNLEDGSFNAAELNAVGLALDQCFEGLELIQREMLLLTAEGEGISKIQSLLTRRPAAATTMRRRAALLALLRIGNDSFTLSAINENLAGCGLNALAEETENIGIVKVSFPEVPGIPDEFAEMSRIIEDIIPCHLEIQYAFWYITWAMMEGRFHIWSDVELLGLTWGELEKMVR